MERDEVALGAGAPRAAGTSRRAAAVTSSGNGSDIVVQDLASRSPAPVARPPARSARSPTIPMRRAVDVRPQQQQRAPGLPSCRRERSGRPRGARRAAAISSAQARSAVVSVRTPGVLPTGDAAPRARGHVDVVEADGVVADDPELRPGRVEELVVDPVGQQRQDAIAAGDAAQELVARRRQLVRPDVGVAGVADRRPALVGDGSARRRRAAGRLRSRGPPRTRAGDERLGSARAPRCRLAWEFA